MGMREEERKKRWERDDCKVERREIRGQPDQQETQKDGRELYSKSIRIQEIETNPTVRWRRP